MSGLKKSNHFNTHVNVYDNKLATDETLKQLQEKIEQVQKSIEPPWAYALKPVHPNWETTRYVVIMASSLPTNLGPMIGGSTATEFVAPLTSPTTFTLNCSGTGASNNVVGGTGLETIKVEGLDGNYDPVSCVVDLNGTAVVTLPIEFLHISQVLPLSAGSSRSLEGSCTIIRSTDNQPYAQLTANEDNTGWFMCPRGYKSVLSLCQRTGGSGATNSLVIWRKGRSTFETIATLAGVGLPVTTRPLAILHEGDSLYANASTDTNSKIILGFELIKIDE